MTPAAPWKSRITPSATHASPDQRRRTSSTGERPLKLSGADILLRTPCALREFSQDASVERANRNSRFVSSSATDDFSQRFGQYEICLITFSVNHNGRGI